MMKNKNEKMLLEIQQLKEALKKEHTEKKQYRSQVKSLHRKLEKSQQKTKELRTELRNEIKKKRMTTGVFPCVRIARHQYDEFVVSFCVELYIRGGSGLRKRLELAAYLNKKLSLGIEKLPCVGTLENWVIKSGYNVYQNVGKQTRENKEAPQDYAQITYESMMVGNPNVLLSLCVPAEKLKNTFLTSCHSQILSIDVCQSWNGESIQQVLEKNSLKMGKAPRYVIKDNDTKMNKAVRQTGYVHIRDINHTLGMFLRRIYKDQQDFESFLKQLGKAKREGSMKPTSYLLPPNQRCVSRYLNLYPLIKWSKSMQNVFPHLSKDEQKTFDFINTYSSLIEELHILLKFIDYVLELIRKKGLSKKHIKQILRKAEKRLSSKNERIRRFKKYLQEYLNEEKAKMKTKDVWNASSDIIESLFGSYKSRKATNPLCGVTPYILILPLLTSFNGQTQTLDVDFKQALEQVSMKDLTKWRQDNLPDNMEIKRRYKLTA